MKETTKPSLAVAMIVRDEEKGLPRSLASVQAIADEIIVVDTGSRDDSKTIAASFGAKVFDFEWCDDFAAARNACLRQVSCDWILHLDADEEVVSTREDLDAHMSLGDTLAYHVKVLVAPDEAAADQAAAAFFALRMLRRTPDLHFKYPIHEQPVIDDMDRVADSSLKIVHFGPFSDARKSRFERNFPLLKRAIQRYPDEGYLWGRLGVEHFSRREFQEAYAAYQKAFQLSGIKFTWIFPMLRDMAYCLNQLGQPQQAVAVLRKLQGQYPDFTDLFFVEAEIALAHRQYQAAAILFNKCRELGEAPAQYSTWAGVGSWRAEEGLREAQSRLPSSGGYK